MPAENVHLDGVFLGSADGAGTPAASIAVDTSTLDGAVEVGAVEIDGVNHACAVVVFPAADVAALNVSSLGSAVRNALLSVS